MEMEIYLGGTGKKKGDQLIDVFGGISGGMFRSVLPCPVALQRFFRGSWLPLAVGDAAGSSTYGVYRPAVDHRGGT